VHAYVGPPPTLSDADKTTVEYWPHRLRLVSVILTALHAASLVRSPDMDQGLTGSIPDA
jgi:hypothetical protein